MSQTNSYENVVEVNEESSMTNENEVEETPVVDENMFFATGHFSIHHQPNDDDVFMGE